MYTYKFMKSVRVIPVSAVLSRVPRERLYLQKWVTPPLFDAAPLKCPWCAGRESGPLLYSNSVICISEIHSEFSDSIQFMQIHTEFRYDAPQGRRACEGA